MNRMDFMPVEQLALLIPIVAIFCTCALVALFFVFKYLRRRRLLDLVHRERMAAIEKGMEVPALPDALLGDSAPPGGSGRALLKGLIWLFVGIGLMVALREENQREAMFALVPIGIGLAYLIYYFVEVRNAAAPTPTDIDAPPRLPVPAKS